MRSRFTFSSLEDEVQIHCFFSRGWGQCLDPLLILIFHEYNHCNLPNKSEEKKELYKIASTNIIELELLSFVTKLYEKAYNSLDIIKLLEDGIFQLTEEKRYEMLISFNKARKEIRNEKILITFILNFVFLDKNTNLENISFM